VIFNFSIFVEQLKELLEEMAIDKSDKFSRKTTPTEFELLVVDASEMLIKKLNYECTIDYSEGGHAFPDIIYNFANGNTYGIEVKSSTRANSSDIDWAILGNSILGSTRIDVIDLYIMFIKVNRNGCLIRTGRYEDSVSDVVVTHSPRYKINLDQDPNNSFFSKSGISYEAIKSSDNPIGLVTEYFKEQGQTAWWIAESTPAVVKSWEEVSEGERKDVLSSAFVLFPELLGSTGSKKYKRLSKWLATNYSIVDSSLRDRFSAGGKVDLKVSDSIYIRMPRIFENFLEHFQQFKIKIDEMPFDVLQLYWDLYSPENDILSERIKYWLKKVESDLHGTKDSEKTIQFLNVLLAEIDRP